MEVAERCCLARVILKLFVSVAALGLYVTTEAFDDFLLAQPSQTGRLHSVINVRMHGRVAPTARIQQCAHCCEAHFAQQSSR